MKLSKQQTLALMRCVISEENLAQKDFVINGNGQCVIMNGKTLESLINHKLLEVYTTKKYPDPRISQVWHTYKVTEHGLKTLKDEIGNFYDFEKSLAAGEWIGK